jgi:hypothetical protein
MPQAVVGVATVVVATVAAVALAELVDGQSLRGAEHRHYRLMNPWRRSRGGICWPFWAACPWTAVWRVPSYWRLRGPQRAGRARGYGLQKDPSSFLGLDPLSGR